MLAELEPDQLTGVLRPKVIGSWLLDRDLADARLDFFISFSSGAALLGSPMLGSYAAANAFLDALAHHRRAEGRSATSINWGFWDEVGMVARFQRAEGRGFAPQGMKSFSPAQGVAALQQLIEQQAIQTAVMPVDWVAWGESHPAARHASLLCHLMSADAIQPGQGGTEPGEAGQGAVDQVQRNRILALPSEARHHELQAFLTEQLSTVLRIPASDIDARQPLNDLGIDSLMAVELRNQVKARLGVVIPIAKLLDEPCIEELADAMVQALTTPDDQIPTMTSAATQGPAVSAVGALEKLDEMSDAEIAQMLDDMLK
jgi:acyl carrier protein